jgi:hypothetical protein
MQLLLEVSPVRGAAELNTFRAAAVCAAVLMCALAGAGDPDKA